MQRLTTNTTKNNKAWTTRKGAIPTEYPHQVTTSLVVKKWTMLLPGALV
jgi:hypothetical protein